MNASRAFYHTFNEKSLIPREEYAWDSYAARLFRYAHYAAYYDNVVYSDLTRYAAQQRAAHGLYKHTRGVYNPVARQNDLLVSSIYGGSIDMEHLTGGAIPLVLNDNRLKDPIRQLFTWSRWAEQKSLYVRWGAQLGDVALKIVDERATGKVRMELLHPGKIRDAEFDSVGNVKAVTIEYEREDQVNTQQLLTKSRFGVPLLNPNKSYVYKEVWYTDASGGMWWETFKNDEPFAYYTDADGNEVQKVSNDYGFVPLVIANHKETGLNWGASSFHNATRKIDEVNDFASLLNDQVRKSVNALWYFAGVRAADELDASTETRDQMPAIYGPADSEPHPMVAPLPIDQALSNLQEMLSELERDMPELALQRIREHSGTATAPGVRAQYSDAIGRIVEARGNYDAALVRAMQMGISIGAFNRYEGFEAFTLDSYASGDIDFYVKDRPVIGDSLSTTEKLTVLGQVAAQPTAIQKLMLKELEYSADEIDDVIAEVEAEKTAAAQQQQPPANGGASDPNAQADSERQMADVWAAIGLPSPQQAQAVAA